MNSLRSLTLPVVLSALLLAPQSANAAVRAFRAGYVGAPRAAHVGGAYYGPHVAARGGAHLGPYGAGYHYRWRVHP